MARPRKVDFYLLPRPVQERFAAATRRSAPPSPLLYSRASRTLAWAYLGASAGLAVVAVIVLCIGWGDPASSVAIHGGKMLGVDVALFAGAAYGVTHAMGILRALDALPWRAGRYLFPGCVVDASGPVLDVWSMGEAESVEQVSGANPGLALRMRDGTKVVIDASSAEQAQLADAALGSLRQALARATAEEDPQMLAELDPLHDRAMSSPIGPTEGMKRVLVVSKRFDWLIALAAGILLGLGLGTTRNATSDEAMFRTVVATGTVAAYELYLVQGVRHADEVRDLLLPRVQLKEAEAQGTVEAVQTFADAHPSSKIDADIDAALRRVMLTALEAAKKSGTIAAIDALAKKYPNHEIDPEIKVARHTFFLQAFDAWKKKAQPDAPTEAFMTRLLGWTENHGPASDLRFRLAPSKTLEDADRSVKRSGHYPAPDALPSKYFTAEAMRPREQRVAESVVQAFASEFPADVLLLHAGPPLDPDAPIPSTGPMLVVDYTFDWARGNSLSVKPPTVFAGMNFSFDASFAVPQAAPLKMSTKARKVAEIWKLKAGDMSREDYEQKIYDAMIDSAFDQLQKKLNDVLL
jgi:hypothetical protein